MPKNNWKIIISKLKFYSGEIIPWILFHLSWLLTVVILDFSMMNGCFGPITNNVECIKSAIVNEQTISEMEIKIYCLCGQCWQPLTDARRMCFRFFFRYCYCDELINKYLFFTKIQTEKCWCVIFDERHGWRVCCVRASPVIFHQNVEKDIQKTMARFVDADDVRPLDERRNELNFIFISLYEYRTRTIESFKGRNLDSVKSVLFNSSQKWSKQ